MSDERKILNKNKDRELICRWLDRKHEKDNNIKIDLLNGTDAIGLLTFGVEGDSFSEDKELLQAKVFEVFGVYDLSVASAAITDCVNSVVIGTGLKNMKLEDGQVFLEKHCNNILSLFKEFRSRDVFDLMIITKLIIIHFMSNRELLGAIVSNNEDLKTQKQARGIKLSRLFLEFKVSLDKNRKPDQEIHVQHNHIYNEGHAIIGSKFHVGGGR